MTTGILILPAVDAEGYGRLTGRRLQSHRHYAGSPNVLFPAALLYCWQLRSTHAPSCAVR
jgi:hypothetical protein